MRPGDVLDFVGYAPGEIEGNSFTPGDVLIAVRSPHFTDPNDPFPDEIIARSWFTRKLDMVFPEEVSPL